MNVREARVNEPNAGLQLQEASLMQSGRRGRRMNTAPIGVYGLAEFTIQGWARLSA